MLVTTLCGNNSYEIGQELERRLKQFLSANNNDNSGIERIDAATLDANLSEVIARLDSPSLFAANKLVVIRDLSKNVELSQLFINWLENVTAGDQSSQVLVVDPSLDGRSKLFKDLKAKTDFIEYRQQKAPLLSDWLIKYVKTNQGTIASSDANYLIAQVGPDQQRLTSEVAKLLTYDPIITKVSIDLLIEPSVDSTTFELADAIFARNRAKATRLYQEQRRLRVEPIMIIGSLAYQLHLLLLVKSAEGESADKIAADSGLNPWSVSKAKQLASAISLRELTAAIDKLIIIDHKSKSARGFNSDDALQYYLLSI